LFYFRLSECEKEEEVKAASKMIFVIKSCKEKGIAILGNKEIEIKDSTTAQVRELGLF
jgi:hypothetical protein